MMHESLPARLRVLRAREGLTLIEAAGKIGIGRDTLSDLERGNRHPVMPTLAKIAEGYGVPVEDLLEEPLPLSEASATGRSGSTAEPHLTVYRTWEDIEASLSLKQIVDIAKGMEDGRISVREDQAPRVQELLQEVEEASKR